MIRLRNYSCYYKVKEGYAVAVDDVTLDVPEGEFLVIMGKSGCGKTTLLRAVLGLCDYTEGELLIDGKSIEQFDKRENAIAYVSQEYALYPHLTVYDNIAYPLRSSKVKQQELDTMVREMAAAVGLDRLLTRMPKQLSGGQQQRLAIARALVKRPKIVLYDEPFSNMDPSLRKELRQLIYDISRNEKQTVMYVTHDTEEAEELADRVMWMHDGKIVHTQVPEREAASEDGYNPPKKRGSRFFAQKAAAEDYTEAMLPRNRKQVFWDVIKLQGWKLMKLGLILLLFALPIHLLAMLENVLIAQLHTAASQLTEDRITAYTIEIQNLRAFINIPLLMIFSVGFSGVSHIIRQFAWGEPVALRCDFLKGIRQNWRQMLVAAWIAGSVQWLCVCCANLSYAAHSDLASYAVYLPMVAAILLGIPVGAYVTACIPVYTNTFGQNARLGAVLFLKAPGKTLGMLACTGVAFVTFVIPNFYCNLIGRILVSVLIPVLMLAWFLYAYSKLDKYINPGFFPELVGRGIVGQSDL